MLAAIPLTNMKIQENTILYIFSAGHSGSTLLTKILGQNGSFFAGGELSNYSLDVLRSSSYCSCKKKYAECEFWQKIGAKHPSANINFYHEFRRYAYLARFYKLFKVLVLPGQISGRLKIKLDDYNMLYRHIFETTNKNIIIDSSKNIFSAVMLARYGEYPFKFIFLHRDGRSVLNSYLKKNYNVFIDEKTITRERGKNSSQVKIMHYWAKQNVLGLLLYIFKYKSVFRIAHEKIVTEPNKYLSDLMNWLGFDYNEEMLKFRINDHILGGNASRINSKGLSNLDMSRWKDGLSLKDIRQFKFRYGWLNFLLGYK